MIRTLVPEYPLDQTSRPPPPRYFQLKKLQAIKLTEFRGHLYRYYLQGLENLNIKESKHFLSVLVLLNSNASLMNILNQRMIIPPIHTLSYVSDHRCENQKKKKKKAAIRCSLDLMVRLH